VQKALAPGAGGFHEWLSGNNRKNSPESNSRAEGTGLLPYAAGINLLIQASFFG
jgi:hypothetical protein